MVYVPQAKIINAPVAHKVSSFKDKKEELVKRYKLKSSKLSTEEFTHLQHMARTTLRKNIPTEVLEKFKAHGFIKQGLGGHVVTPKGQAMAYIGKVE